MSLTQLALPASPMCIHIVMTSLTQLALPARPLSRTATVVVVETRQTLAAIIALYCGLGTGWSIKLGDVAE